MFQHLLNSIQKPKPQQPYPTSDVNDLLNKFNSLGMDIQCAEECDANSNAGQNQWESQVISNRQLNNEEENPMILSNINHNFKNNIDRAVAMRIRNYCAELQESHQQMLEYMEEEKTTMDYFREKVCFQIQEFFLQIKTKWQISKIDHHLVKEKQESNDFLQQKIKKLQENLLDVKQKNEFLQEQNKILQINSAKTQQIRQKQQLNTVKPDCQCSQYQMELYKLNSHLSQSEQQINKLLIENQQLQEYVFDMQQKMVGVELQVQKRLKDQSKKYEIDSNPNAVTIQQLSIISNLNKEIEDLNVKIHRYEQICLQQSVIKDKQSKLTEKQRSITNQQAKLELQTGRLEREREKAQLRANQISTTEGILAKKIAEIKKKELELQNRQKQIQQLQNAYIRKNSAKQMLQLNNVHSNNDLSQEQMSLRSFGNIKNHYAEQNMYPYSIPSPRSHEDSFNQEYKNLANYEGRTPVDQQIYEHKYQKNGLIPDLKLGKNPQKYDPAKHERYQRFQNERKREEIKKQINIPQHHYSKQKKIDTRNENLSKNSGSQYHYVPHQNNYMTGEGFKPKTTSFRQPNHIHDTPLASPKGNFRDLSKNSRSSASKSVRGYNLKSSGFKSSGVAPKMTASPKENAQFTGLGSKLQRLREQIRKQIDSIK